VRPGIEKGKMSATLGGAAFNAATVVAVSHSMAEARSLYWSLGFREIPCRSQDQADGSIQGGPPPLRGERAGAWSHNTRPLRR